MAKKIDGGFSQDAPVRERHLPNLVPEPRDIPDGPPPWLPPRTGTPAPDAGTSGAGSGGGDGGFVSDLGDRGEEEQD